ncbi:hypothetical protein [Sporosalibacterium faouarense]|uniref:hypothetical protein n=1 Tax=Sporosalibacterium faouarense TaxID=516123 RepID=UPI00192C83FF|nr:hypothetical protein [Sporosalibacterium faouarense]
MKFYYIILGLGIGLVLGGTFFILNPKIEYKYMEYTDDEILEKAAAIKLEDAKNKETNENDSDFDIDEEADEGKDTKNEGQSDDLGTEGEDQTNENNTEGLKQDDVEDNEDEIVDNSNDESQQEEDDDQKDEDNTVRVEDEEELITIRIYWGDSSEEIVHKLYDKGVIDDKKGLNDYILENRAEKKLKPGTYEFGKGTSFEEILHELLQ